MNSHRAQIRAIVEVLKKRFPNLTGTEVVDLAFDILEAIHAAADAQLRQLNNDPRVVTGFE